MLQDSMSKGSKPMAARWRGRPDRLPPVVGSRPSKALRRLDLPDPLAPIRAQHSPARNSREIGPSSKWARLSRKSVTFKLKKLYLRLMIRKNSIGVHIILVGLRENLNFQLNQAPSFCSNLANPLEAPTFSLDPGGSLAS